MWPNDFHNISDKRLLSFQIVRAFKPAKIYHSFYEYLLFEIYKCYRQAENRKDFTHLANISRFLRGFTVGLE